MDAVSPTLVNLIIFVLAIYVGYHVVWTVTPALHTPLMAVTNAISAIVIVGAMLAAAMTTTTLGKTMGVLAVALAAVNVFGGFMVTRRMLEMFKKKDRPAKLPKEKRHEHGFRDDEFGDAAVFGGEHLFYPSFERLEPSHHVDSRQCVWHAGNDHRSDHHGGAYLEALWLCHGHGLGLGRIGNWW